MSIRLTELSIKDLRSCKRTLEHARMNRTGGLLITEQIALDNIDKALNEQHSPVRLDQ